ncbi:zinc ABC transporter substrate-binding protein [Skermanella pratensis]|uniref:zinc ABC transporter substrate-binding protein n=1 Tax=Skermanella pratensis TaxID=2233999 RepID=UPI001300D289|nr:zinc ABC transporter substrate-binding protein [Skermanella pratensis]
MNARRATTSLLALAGAAFFTAAFPPAAPAAEPVGVVASVKPVHSLVAGVMQGVAEPTLLVKGAASPHSFSLRPSDARALNGADLIFWVGEDLETFLAKPIDSLAGKARVTALMEAPGITLLPTREGGAWEPHEAADHGHEHGHGHGHDDHAEGGHRHGEEHAHGTRDAHIWLDVSNARAMVAAIARELSEHDPANAARYQANAKSLAERLTALDAELGTLLAPVKDRPFVVFHDAYHYLEDRYGLNAVGAITVSPEQRPSAQRLSEIRGRIGTLDAACVFAEPQFEPTLVATVVEGTGAGKGMLDPLGAGLPDGPDLYFQLMRDMAASLVSCLKAG